MSDRVMRNAAPIDLNDARSFERGIPHEAFAEMRATPGLTWTPDTDQHGAGFWSVTRHADLVAVSRDTETYSSAVGHGEVGTVFLLPSPAKLHDQTSSVTNGW